MTVNSLFNLTFMYELLLLIFIQVIILLLDFKSSCFYYT